MCAAPVLHRTGSGVGRCVGAGQCQERLCESLGSVQAHSRDMELGVPMCAVASGAVHWAGGAWQALVADMHLWVERVPSADNIADAPSRESYDLMRALDARWRPPVVAQLFAEGGLRPCAQLHR